MKLRTFRHYLGTALHNLFRNRLMTVASMLTVASCVFIVSVFYLLAVNIRNAIEQLEEEIMLVAFLEDELPDGVEDIYERITAIPNVRRAAFIPPEEGIEIFNVEMWFQPGRPMADDLRGDNPLRRAFAIDIQEIQLHGDVVVALEALGPYGIYSVVSEQGLVDAIWTFTWGVQIVSLTAILILGLISFVIIINTIRITVSSRQAEINIMKYVGATDWFIRWPFVIEGILIGLIGAAIPAVICVVGYDRVIARLTQFEMLDYRYFMPGEQVLFYVVLYALVLGALIGLFGSVVSIRKYLKV